MHRIFDFTSYDMIFIITQLVIFYIPGNDKNIWREKSLESYFRGLLHLFDNLLCRDILRKASMVSSLTCHRLVPGVDAQ